MTTNSTSSGPDRPDLDGATAAALRGDDMAGKLPRPPFVWFSPRAPHPGEPDLDDVLWTMEHLARFLPWGRTTLFALVGMEAFPQGLLLPGPRGSKRVWLRHDVLRWVDAAPRAHSTTRPSTERLPLAGAEPAANQSDGPTGWSSTELEEK